MQFYVGKYPPPDTISAGFNIHRGSNIFCGWQGGGGGHDSLYLLICRYKKAMPLICLKNFSLDSKIMKSVLRVEGFW